MKFSIDHVHVLINGENYILKIPGKTEYFNKNCSHEFSIQEMDIWNNNIYTDKFKDAETLILCNNIAHHFELHEYLNKFKYHHHIDFEDDDEEMKKLIGIESIPKYILTYNDIKKNKNLLFTTLIKDENINWLDKELKRDNLYLHLVWYLCCKYGKSSVLDYLIWNYFEGYTTECIKIAVENNNLKIIKILQSMDIELHKNFLTGNDSIEMIEYFEDQGIPYKKTKKIFILTPI